MKTYYQLDSFNLEVKVVDNRKSYGREELLIIPVSGSGEKWVYKDRVVETDKKLASKVTK